MNSVILLLILSTVVAVGLTYPYGKREDHVRVRRLQPRGGYSGGDSYAGTRQGVTGEQRGEVKSADFKVLSDVYGHTDRVYGSYNLGSRSSRVGSRVNGGW